MTVRQGSREQQAAMMQAYKQRLTLVVLLVAIGAGECLNGDNALVINPVSNCPAPSLSSAARHAQGRCWEGAVP